MTLLAAFGAKRLEFRNALEVFGTACRPLQPDERLEIDEATSIAGAACTWESRTASAKRSAAIILSTRSAGVSRRFSLSSVRSIPPLQHR